MKSSVFLLLSSHKEPIDFTNSTKRRKRNSESDEWIEPDEIESDESFNLSDDDAQPNRKRWINN